jgi:hypothetical protein
MRTKLLTLLATSMAVVGIGLLPTMAAAKPASPAKEATASVNCGSGVVCVFTNTFFNGAEGQTACGAEGAHPLAGWKESAINHCANRPVWTRVNGSANACMPAGGQIEHFGFNEIWIGAIGGHCN